MRYVMRPNFLSLGHNFTIKDDRGDVAYRVRRVAFSFGGRLSLLSPSGKELARLTKRLFAWRPTVQVDRDGKRAATIQKKVFTFIRNRFMINVAGGGSIDVEGSLLDREYTLMRGGETIATASKKWFSLSENTYGIDVADGEDDALVVAVVTAIDMLTRQGDLLGSGDE